MDVGVEFTDEDDEVDEDKGEEEEIKAKVDAGLEYDAGTFAAAGLAF